MHALMTLDLQCLSEQFRREAVHRLAIMNQIKPLPMFPSAVLARYGLIIYSYLSAVIIFVQEVIYRITDYLSLV